MTGLGTRPAPVLRPRGSQPYDEAFEPAGARRPAYAALDRILGWDPLRPPAAITRHLGRRVLGDAPEIVPIPVVLDDIDHGLLQAGVAQRAHALWRFFVDIALGDRRCLGGATALSAALLDEILQSERTSLQRLRDQWRGRDPETIRFVYAPDLVREPGGRWVVLEDNVGCVGGCADGHLVHEAYMDAVGLDHDRRPPDLAVALGRWLEALGLAPDDPGVVALLGHGDPGCSPRFTEDRRRAVLVRDAGVRVVDDDAFVGLCRDLPSRSHRLRAVANLGAPSPATTAALCDVAFQRLRVPLLNAPGTGILGNKGLLPYIPEMIGFFCGARPILDTPQTLLLCAGELPPDPPAWVVKTLAGAQGTGVSILREQSPRTLAAVAARVRGSWPEHGVVAQRHVEASRLPALSEGAGTTYLVEIRVPTYVLGAQTMHVADRLVARVVRDRRPQRLRNLASGGAYAPVLRGPPKRSAIVLTPA